MITRPGVIRKVGVLESPAPTGPAKKDCSSLMAGVCIDLDWAKGRPMAGFLIRASAYGQLG